VSQYVLESASLWEEEGNPLLQAPVPERVPLRGARVEIMFHLQFSIYTLYPGDRRWVLNTDRTALTRVFVCRHTHTNGTEGRRGLRTAARR
jgi:hypothetical protein